MAQRVMISRTTLVKVERGDAGVSIGVTWRVKNSQSESLRQGNRNMERVIEVFVELDGGSQFVGRLWSRSLKGRESASLNTIRHGLHRTLALRLSPY